MSDWAAGRTALVSCPLLERSPRAGRLRAWRYLDEEEIKISNDNN